MSNFFADRGHLHTKAAAQTKSPSNGQADYDEDTPWSLLDIQNYVGLWHTGWNGVSAQGVVIWSANMEELLESKRALKDTETSYQLTPQCQVFLPPAAETRQLSSGAVLGQGVSQSQRPQYQALLPLLAELQLAQPGQARFQALLGPTALHSHRERERTVHASPLRKIPGFLAQQT